MILRLKILILLCLVSGNLPGQVITNQQAVVLKTNSLLDSIATHLPDSMNTVALKINTTDRDVRSFLINQVAQYFSKLNCIVSMDSAEYEIVFENFDIKIEYTERKSGMLGLSINLDRLIHLTSSGYLIDNKKINIIKAFNLKTDYNDNIDSSVLSEVEVSRYGFCRGKRISAVAWTKYIKPAVVISSVASVIFLLFTKRF